MLLNPADFNQFLTGTSGVGQTIDWRRAELCACARPDSGAANPHCIICDGRGRFWPHPPIRTRAGISSQETTREWATFGQFEAGDALVIIPENSSMYEAGHFDRLTMLNATDRFALSLLRGERDRIHIHTQTITNVFWIDPVTGLNVHGTIPTIDAAGNLSWPAGGGPPHGRVYTVTGTRFNEYFVWHALTSDHAHHFGARLPRTLIARRFDLFGR